MALSLYSWCLRKVGFGLQRNYLGSRSPSQQTFLARLTDQRLRSALTDVLASETSLPSTVQWPNLSWRMAYKELEATTVFIEDFDAWFGSPPHELTYTISERK